MNPHGLTVLAKSTVKEDLVIYSQMFLDIVRV